MVTKLLLSDTESDVAIRFPSQYMRILRVAVPPMDHASKATVCVPGGTAPAAEASEPSPRPADPFHVMVPSVAISSWVFAPVFEPQNTLTADARDAAKVK